MERELLIEIGCEELPATWLRPLIAQLAERLAARLTEFRLASDAPVEAFATPRRLTATVSRIAERQTEFEETISGPPVSAAFGPDGQPTPAAIGFARKQGVEVGELTRQSTPKGSTWRSSSGIAGRRPSTCSRTCWPGRCATSRFPSRCTGTPGWTMAAASCRSGGRSAGCCSSTAGASSPSRSVARHWRPAGPCRRCAPARRRTGTGSSP